MGRNRVIGLDGALPWRLPADLKAFKALTLGKPVIMGRKTWASLDCALPGRLNLVVSRNPRLEVEGAVLCSGLEAAVKAAADSGAGTAMIIGGASLYQAALEFADEMFLTLVHAEPEGDTWFPEFDESDWELVTSNFRGRDEKNCYDMEFRRYRRLVNRA